MEYEFVHKLLAESYTKLHGAHYRLCRNVSFGIAIISDLLISEEAKGTILTNIGLTISSSGGVEMLAMSVYWISPPGVGWKYLMALCDTPGSAQDLCSGLYQPSFRLGLKPKLLLVNCVSSLRSHLCKLS